MENLKSLARLINKHKIKQIEIIGTATDTSSKLYRLYEGIISGDLDSDEQALAYLYRPGNQHPSDVLAYHKLKLRLEDRLCNTVFFIDQNQAKFNTPQSAYYNSYKNLAAFRILLGRSARRAAIPLGEKALRQAHKFGITPVVLELATDLRNHFAVNEANAKKFSYYHDIAGKAHKLRQAELEAEGFYAELMLKSNGKRSSDTILAERAGEFAAALELTKAQLENPSFRFLHLYFMIRVLQFEIRNDVAQMVQVCQEALRYSAGQTMQVSNAFYFTFAFRLLQTKTKAEQFEEAEKLSRYCDNLVPEGSANWFLIRYVKVVLGFHWNNFGLAYQVYRKASDHRSFSLQSRLDTERWMIIEGYMQYLMVAGKIPGHTAGISPENFKIHRFINDFYAFSKDKAGYNVDLIILRILFRLQKKDYDDIVENLDVWQQYASRYLNKNQSKRSKYFLKMLLSLPKFYFQRSTVVQKTRNLLTKLKGVAQTAVDPEIIPYETLWEFLLDSLDNRRH